MLRVGVALCCSEPKLETFGLGLLACGVHGGPDERGQLRRCERGASGTRSVGCLTRDSRLVEGRNTVYMQTQEYPFWGVRRLIGLLYIL